MKLKHNKVQQRPLINRQTKYIVETKQSYIKIYTVYIYYIYMIILFYMYIKLYKYAMQYMHNLNIITFRLLNITRREKSKDISHTRWKVIL